MARTSHSAASMNRVILDDRIQTSFDVVDDVNPEKGERRVQAVVPRT